ncbi:MAG: nucleoside triphosphate pyrophosphohydrolase [Flavobacteriales bacterium]|nr:nucleoside triphosphate pyrophosphohydrolase [Flavobacteriales bacterium]
MKETESNNFEKLLKIMDELREKCPWDRKQTMDSLRHLTIEEMYELSDAIIEKNYNELCKELGDVLLHIVFYAKIGAEQGHFDMNDVIEQLNQKLITRHPHIYGEVKVDDEDAVKRNWESIKLKEGKISVLQGVPQGLPALIKAYRIQDKARGVGFEWTNRKDVWHKVEEEMAELQQAVENNESFERIEDELGDVFFSLINYARFINQNPEDALERTNRKFIRRFQHMEKRAKENGLAINELSLKQLDVWWNEAKQTE